MLGAALKQIFGFKRRKAADAAWLARAGEAQRGGRFAQAEAICRAQLAENASELDALQALAAALLAQGRTKEAIIPLQQAVEREPANARLHANLAFVYGALGQLPAAIESYRRAVAPPAPDEKAWLPLASLLKITARYDEAEQICRAGLVALPASVSLRHLLASVLFEQGRVDEAAAGLRAALALEPGAAAVHSDLLRTFYYADAQDNAAAYREHRAWAQRHAQPLESAAPAHTNNPDPARRLRVGYVSPYFRKHAVIFFFETIIHHHDRAAFEIFLYADVAQPDEYSTRLREYGSTWRDTVGMTDEAMAQLVRDDRIDILVDLNGQTPNNRLLMFARRPAPIQLTSLTTGMASVEYRITDAYADPPGATEHLHSEKPLRLPGFYSAWRPPDLRAEAGRLPALSSAAVTFGSFNSCFKITPTTVAVWSRILRGLPHSSLKLLAFDSDVATRRVRAMFGEHGIEPARLEFMPRMTFDEYFLSRTQVDVALDTFPFHGVTTTCDSLWMGVPVVVLAGANYFSRVGVSILENLGLPQLIAHTADEYVEIALHLANDLPALARMRAGLRDTLLKSPVTDGAACARNLEQSYREMWIEWCRQKTAPAGC